MKTKHLIKIIGILLFMFVGFSSYGQIKIFKKGNYLVVDDGSGVPDNLEKATFKDLGNGNFSLRGLEDGEKKFYKFVAADVQDESATPIGTSSQVLAFLRENANFKTPSGGSGGAVLNADTSTAIMQFVLDEDDFISDSPTKLATQQSIKAFIATQGASTLQAVYDGSALTEVTTNATNLALTLQRGSALDTDLVLEVKDGTAATNYSVDGTGDLIAKDIDLNGAFRLLTDVAFDNTLPNRLFKSTNDGFVMQGGSGSLYDLSLITQAGGFLYRNPTGTTDNRFNPTSGNFAIGNVGVTIDEKLEIDGKVMSEGYVMVASTSAVIGALHRHQDLGDTALGPSYYTLLINGGKEASSTSAFDSWFVDNAGVDAQGFAINRDGFKFLVADATVNDEVVTAVEKFSVDASGAVTATSFSGDGSALTGITNGNALFIQTADATITNTTVETTLFATGVGTKTIAAADLVVGRKFKVRLQGIVKDVSNPSIQLKIKLGTTIIADTNLITTLAIGAANEHWILDLEFVVRTEGVTGTIMASGGFLNSKPDHFSLLNTSAITIDTTINQILDVTAQWGVADEGNVIVCQIAEIDPIKN